jgi:ribosomal protein S18 acetylase RimI-like enzyme
VSTPASPPRIRKATPDDVPDLADSLARAFHGDPGFSHLLPDPSDRTERLRGFFETELRGTGIPLDLTWTTDDLSGGAVWMPPEGWRVPVSTTLRELAPMTRVFGRRLVLAFRSRMRMEARHPKKPSHGYLLMMGVAPEHQGLGLGTALLEPGLALWDGARTPAYLEASSTRSRELYRRNGFEVTGQLDLPSGGPPLWLMWREPP